RPELAPAARRSATAGDRGHSIAITGVVGPHPREVVHEHGQRVAPRELEPVLRPGAARPPLVDGLADGLDELEEIAAGAAERHSEGTLAVLEDARQLARDVEIGRRRELEEETPREPLLADRGVAIRAPYGDRRGTAAPARRGVPGGDGRPPPPGTAHDEDVGAKGLGERLGAR